MARQLLLVSLGLLLALAAGSGQAGRPHPDCSNTFVGQGASFSTINSVCGQITDAALFRTTLEMEDGTKKLETVESCSCALVNHELAWSSLMTHDLVTLYQAIKQFVDQRAKGNKAVEALINGPAVVLFEGEEGQRRFYWDTLDYILKSATGENDDEDISLAVRQNFANLFYETGTLELKYAKLVQSQKLRMAISKICDNVINKFAKLFLPLFDRLAKLADNDHIFYMLTAYNEDLYKLRMSSRVCIYLIEHGQLVNNY